MLEINIENMASTKFNFHFIKNIDGSKFYHVILNRVN